MQEEDSPVRLKEIENEKSMLRIKKTKNQL